MKTHIEIDDAMLAAVQQLGGFATKDEAVHAALVSLARKLAALELLEMRGTLKWDADEANAEVR